MGWSVWVTDTVTGVKQQRLPVSAFTWSRVLNGGGSGSATVQLSDSVTRLLDVKTLTIPAKNTLVLESTHGLAFGVPPVVVYAGVIWSRTYDHPTATLTIQHSDIWSLLNRRLAIDKTVPFSAVVHQTYTAVSSATLVKRLITLAVTGAADMNLGLRITKPADEVGPITRTNYGYHMNVLGDLLDGLMNEDGGTDIDFAPRWVSGELDYLMRTGTVAVPKLTAGLYEWNLQAEQSGLVGLSVTEDANKLATSAYAVGEGSEEDMLVYSDRVISPQYPGIDHIESYKTVDNAYALSAKAVGDLIAFKQPTAQTSFSVLASGTPAVTALQLGGTVKVWSKGDLWLADGFTSSRLIEFSGDLSENVKLEFQPGGA